jgi:hypothetical protein
MIPRKHAHHFENAKRRGVQGQVNKHFRNTLKPVSTGMKRFDSRCRVYCERDSKSYRPGWEVVLQDKDFADGFTHAMLSVTKRELFQDEHGNENENGGDLGLISMELFERGRKCRSMTIKDDQKVTSNEAVLAPTNDIRTQEHSKT